MKDGIKRLWRALFPLPGEFLCTACGETFSGKAMVRAVAIDEKKAAELGEPEAVGQVRILKFCPGCYTKTKDDYGGF